MRKKLYSILLLTVLILPTGCTFIWLNLKKYQVKKEVKQLLIKEIDIDELVLLKFDENQKKNLYWEHGKEFKYKGIMYDIVKSQKNKNITYYWCWPDKKESKINQNLERLALGKWRQLPEKQQQTDKLIHFLKNLYYEESTNFKMDSNTSIKKHFFYYVQQEYNTFRTSHTPPPRYKTLHS